MAGEKDILDFRSDTVTHPTEEMRLAMSNCPLGDDVYGEDPTINELEAYTSHLLNKPASIFLPTATMSNLIATLVHCEGRLSEYIVGDMQHLNLYEAGGVSAFGGVHTRAIKNLEGGTLDLEQVRGAIRDKDIHYPVTRMIAVENTHNRAGGRVLPMDFLKNLRTLVDDHNERNGEKDGSNRISLHMDGARLFNAATALNLAPAAITSHVDSVTICLSKGLCCPAGALLSGQTRFIQKARHLRKALGGGMRQSGVLAAAGLIALQKMTKRLGEDNTHAKMLAKGLTEIEINSNKMFEILGGVNNVDTNMFYGRFLGRGKDNASFGQKLKELGIVIDCDGYGAGGFRMVTHNDVDIGKAGYVLDSFKKVARDIVSS